MQFVDFLRWIGSDDISSEKKKFSIEKLVMKSTLEPKSMKICSSPKGKDPLTPLIKSAVNADIDTRV